MPCTIALIGNQNCGKTALFNRLTGANQHVGNYPGVTVAKKTGVLRGARGVQVVDLPGLYTLSPYTAEERVSLDFLLDEKPDVILNIVDATQLERNLYLTLQLLEIGRPMIVALNMMDEVRKNRTVLDVDALSQALGVPVLPVSARRNQGIAALAAQCAQAAGRACTPHAVPHAPAPQATGPARDPWGTGEAAHALREAVSLLHALPAHPRYPLRYAAPLLLEGDAYMARALALPHGTRAAIAAISQRLARRLDTDCVAALVEMRYARIADICGAVIRARGESVAARHTAALDRVLAHRVLAIPLFMLCMGAVFALTFGPPGAALARVFRQGIAVCVAWVDVLLVRAAVHETLRSLLVDGVLTGAQSVLAFLPTIVLLFFLLSLLEDTGYMARVAYVLDRPMRRLGLSGRSLLPALIGFGCSVPAILATRTLPGERERRKAVALVPFMSCSAKLPIYAAFAAAFFPAHRALVALALYALGVAVAAVAALALRHMAFRGAQTPFLMELPPYRMPTIRSVLLHMWDKAEDFVRRAFTVLLLASLAIWFLQRYDATLTPVMDNAQSMLATMGRFLAPLFAPLGFGSWQAATALLSGLLAKESVVATLAILLGVEGGDALALALPGLFTARAACAYLTFILLYTPCVAALSAARRELGTWRAALCAAACQACIAWGVAWAVWWVAGLLGV